HIIDIKVCDAPAFDFSGESKLLKCLYCLTQRHVPTPVQEVKIDCFNTKTLETALACLGQLRSGCVVGIDFRDNKHAVALTFDCVGHNLFCAAFAVHLCGVDQSHAEINSQTQSRDFLCVSTFLFTHAPRALTQDRNAFTIGKCNGLHFVLVFLTVIAAEQGNVRAST